MSNFYDENYRQYFDSTVGIDPSAFLQPLADRLRPPATILDVGCGSGRDLLWLASRGYTPTGFELAPKLASLAREHANCPVIEGDFCHYDFSALRFSALVFVGSLVHLPKETLPLILKSTCLALAPDGLLLITLKEGRGFSCADDGRVFTLWSRKEIEKIFAAHNIQVLDFSKQVSKLRSNDIWLGYVLRLNNGP
nr:class I SAM-dependent methyltransferase [Desulfobulbaceae bacterium]